MSNKTVVIFNAAPNCVDADTEYLTKTGWKKICDYSEGEEIAVTTMEGVVTFETPSQYVNVPFEGDFLVFSRKSFEMKLTSNHTVLFEDKKGHRKTSEWKELFSKIEDNAYGLRVHIPKTFNIIGQNQEYDLNKVLLKVAIMADSSLLKNGVQFNLKKGRKIQRLRNLLKFTDIEYKEYTFESMPDYTRFVLKTDIDKTVDWSWLQLPTEIRNTIVDEFLLWDGDQKQSFFTGSKDEADFFQTLASSCNRACSIYKDVRVGRNTNYEVHLQQKSTETLTKRLGVEREKPQTYKVKAVDQKCYCFTTSTGFWVARKNDTIFLTGNSGKDVSADYLHEYFQSGQRLSFKEALYEDTAEYFDIDVKDLTEYHSDRSLKEVPSLMFPKHGRNSLLQMLYSIWYVIGALINNRYLMSLGYYSSREALIHVSEEVVKPEYGEDYYGQKIVYKIQNSPDRYVFLSDGGFKSELTPLLDKGYNVHIVKLERSGATFERDSRTLLNEDDFKAYSNIKFTTISNNGSLDDLYDNIREFAFDLVLNTTKEFYGGGNMEEIQSEYEIVET